MATGEATENTTQVTADAEHDPALAGPGGAPKAFLMKKKDVKDVKADDFKGGAPAEWLLDGRTSK